MFIRYDNMFRLEHVRPAVCVSGETVLKPSQALGQTFENEYLFSENSFSSVLSFDRRFGALFALGDVKTQFAQLRSLCRLKCNLRSFGDH